jgi:L-lactate dehydrogenase complex protein LldG
MAESSRAEILGRVRAALADQPRPAPIPREYRHDRDLGDLVALAAERIADYRATVHRCSPEELPRRIAEVLGSRGIHTVAVPPGLPAEWLVDGFEWRPDTAGLSVPELDAVDGVLTGCALAIAETGTIVLDADPDQGRRALTLLPDYHLCVVHAGQIVATVPQAVAALRPERPLTFISGPSATSDIEFNRVEGVHGPRTLDVLLTGH